MRNEFYSALAAFFILAGTPAFAEEGPSTAPEQDQSKLQGTPKDQTACSPDAARFCSDDFPDTFKVLSCLQEHRKRLRKACLKVLEEHGQ